jgi:hypothetical protein
MLRASASLLNTFHHPAVGVGETDEGDAHVILAHVADDGGRHLYVILRS